jgi:hypothetical protein
MVGVETRIAPASDAGLALKNSELEWLLRQINGCVATGHESWSHDSKWDTARSRRICSRSRRVAKRVSNN